MIISQRYTERLIRERKARVIGRTTSAPTWAEREYGKVYLIVERLDLQRIDHARVRSLV